MKKSNAILKLISLPLISLFLLGASGCLESLGLVKPRDGGFLFSDDAGESWKSRNDIKDTEKALDRESITYIDVASENQDIVYAGTMGKGLYKTENSGEKWKLLWDTELPIYRVKVDPNNNDVIYVVTEHGDRGRIFKSTDGGDKFEEMYVTSDEEMYINYMVLDQHNPDTLYILAEDTGLFKSSDGAKSWKEVHWFEDHPLMLKISPINPDHFFVFTEEQYLFSGDQGKTWIDLTYSLEDFEDALIVNDFVFCPENPMEIYLASDYGLLRSKNYGKTWERVPLIIPPEAVAVVTVAIDPRDSDTILAGANGSIYKSTDRGIHWEVYKLETSKFITNITYNQTDSRKVYAGLWSAK